MIERLRGCERAEQGGLHRAQSVWRLRVPDSVSRRHSGRDRRPGMVRESPSQIHCDTGDTLLHTPLFGRGLQPGSPLSAITVVCSSASSKVCVSAMLRNSLFLRKRSGSLRTSHPTPGGMSSTTRTEAGGFFVSGVTISLLRCGAATLVLFLPSSIVSPIRVKALGYGQVPVWWGGQCGGVSGQGC